ncbi:IS66 family transposase [Natronocella acetinitrilica]
MAAKSTFKGAVRYTLERWQALKRCRDNRCIEIDNNAVERRQSSYGP